MTVAQYLLDTSVAPEGKLYVMSKISGNTVELKLQDAL